jgi:hypothetical protein
MSADRKVVHKRTMIECCTKKQFLNLLEAIDNHKESCMSHLRVVLVLLTSCGLLICVVYYFHVSHQQEVSIFFKN